MSADIHTLEPVGQWPVTGASPKSICLAASLPCPNDSILLQFDRVPRGICALWLQRLTLVQIAQLAKVSLAETTAELNYLALVEPGSTPLHFRLTTSCLLSHGTV